jgi:hypothetical protein
MLIPHLARVHVVALGDEKHRAKVPGPRAEIALYANDIVKSKAKSAGDRYG